MPETTSAQRPIVASDRLPSSRRIARPTHIAPVWDIRLLSISDRACDLLEPLAAEGREPTIGEAAALLPQWTLHLGYFVQESSSSLALDRNLMRANRALWPAIDRWLAGHWSTRPGLIELIWRCGLSAPVIGSALWLHDAVMPPSDTAPAP